MTDAAFKYSPKESTKNPAVKNKKDLYILDLILADNLYFQNILKRKIYIEFEGTSIPLISLEDLIILKCISNRAEDQNDITKLITIVSPEV